MTQAERIAELEERIDRLEALVPRCHQIAGILGGERRAQEQAARMEHRRRFDTAPSAEARLEIFAAATEPERSHLVETITPVRWVEILRETAPADRAAYVAAMRRTPAGGPLARFVAFELAPPPDVVTIELTAERSVSVDLRPGVELRRGCPIRFHRGRWIEEFANADLYGERIRAMEAAGEITVSPAADAVARAFARADVDQPTPSITS